MTRVDTLGAMSLSFFGVEPGVTSSDNTVIIGKSGYLFVLRGSNYLDEQYRIPIEDEKVKSVSEAWRGLFQSRSEFIRSQNAEYVQLIIPEKSSILNEYFPTPISGETAYYRSVKKSAVSAEFVDVDDALRSGGSAQDLFRRMDSHLTPAGSLIVFNAILQRLGLPAITDVQFDVEVFIESDLGKNIFGFPFKERVLLPRSSHLNALSNTVELVSHIDMEPGKHLGKNYVYKNPAAPFKKKVVALGNSFFSEGTNPSNLTWWGARYFSEFHFLWSPKIEREYILQNRPDIVICQSIERFLPILPDE